IRDLIVTGVQTCALPIYGQTEISGISCIHRDERIKFHTVGEPIPGTEVRISERGEILSRSPAVFLGYYKNDEATRATLTDGWLQIGRASCREGVEAWGGG